MTCFHRLCHRTSTSHMAEVLILFCSVFILLRFAASFYVYDILCCLILLLLCCFYCIFRLKWTGVLCYSFCHWYCDTFMVSHHRAIFGCKGVATLSIIGCLMGTLHLSFMTTDQQREHTGHTLLQLCKHFWQHLIGRMLSLVGCLLLR